MKRKASSPLERSVKRIATSPGSGRELMQLIRERNIAMPGRAAPPRSKPSSGATASARKSTAARAHAPKPSATCEA